MEIDNLLLSSDVFKFYKVGGCVRDILLGVDYDDVDYTVVLKSTLESDLKLELDLDFNRDDIFQKLCEYLEKDFTISVKTPKFFTIKAKYKNNNSSSKDIIDFVLARREHSYVEGTRSPVIELGDIYDDLIRRDFTVNALAIDCDTGEVVDVCGGLEDIREKILRTIKDPNISLFEDPLRLLRGLRFSIVKDFRLDHGFWEAVSNREIWEKLNKVVSPGRVRHELNKMFEYDTVKTLSLLNKVQTYYDGAYISIFKNITLKPCVENNNIQKN